ncbi:MAG TPA: hypothetical protein VJA26_18555 [Gammaproteobacteria bacterium]|nr:hypothetical protein [Gammaproteobacteria bacterium]
MRDFDRHFNRTRSTINVMFWAIVTVQVVLVSAVVYVGIVSFDAIQERGLKAVLTSIWEGPSNE